MSIDSVSAPRFEPVALGTVLGLVSAVGYTAANIFLRASIHSDPFWVSCIKATPTVIIIGPWMFVRAWRRQAIVASSPALAWLLVMGLVGQLGGNVLFQWSLGIVGIALAVPLTLGAMILSGVFVGRSVLRESVSGRMMLAIVVLLVAIIVLGLGARAANQSIEGAAAAAGGLSVLRLVAGVLAACASGCAYSFLGAAIRSAAQRGVPQSTTLIVVASVGLLSLGLLSASRIGVSGMLGTEPHDLGIMLLAGLCNLVAFWSLTKAFEVIGLVYLNALNASQSAMAAVAGVVFFREPPSTAMVIGVLLSIVGLYLMKGDQSASNAVGESKSEAADVANRPKANADPAEFAR